MAEARKVIENFQELRENSTWQSADGRLRDRVGQAAIYVRIARAEAGNFGDHKLVGEGVQEMRIAAGPGYRLYYALDGGEVILLLLGGDKSTQARGT